MKYSKEIMDRIVEEWCAVWGLKLDAVPRARVWENRTGAK